MTENDYIRVRDVMTTDLQMMDGLATISEVLMMMRSENIGSVIIAKRDQQDEYGLVTVGDIARNVISHNRAADRVSAYEAMTKPILTLDPDMAIKYAVRLLNNLGVDTALVTDKRELMGIVTFKDMVLRYPV